MNTSGKTIKWTIQRTPKDSNRVEKRQPQKTTRKTKPSRVSGKQSENKSQCIVKQAIKKLEAELEFTQDAMASVIVNLESIHHAYKSSESELEGKKSATRLCEKEKELLTAYGDVKLQASHLERKIAKLEHQIHSLKEQEETTAPPYLSSPCSSIDTSLSYTTPMVGYAHPDPLLDTLGDISYQPMYYPAYPVNNDFYGLDQFYACNPLFDEYYSCDQLFYYDNAYPML